MTKLGRTAWQAASGGDAALAAGFVVLWSSGFIGAKLGTPNGDAYSMLMWRFLLAAALLLAWRVLRRGRRRRLSARRDRRPGGDRPARPGRLPARRGRRRSSSASRPAPRR